MGGRRGLVGGRRRQVLPGPGTLEDTSNSGACIRVGKFIHIGSKVVIKWHREQFPAVTRNCRRDGKEFLLGVMREPATSGDPQFSSSTKGR